MGKRDILMLRVNIHFETGNLINRIVDTVKSVPNGADTCQDILRDQIGHTGDEYLDYLLYALDYGPSLFMPCTDALNESSIKISEDQYKDSKIEDGHPEQVIEPMLTINMNHKDYDHVFNTLFLWLSHHIVPMDGNRDTVIGMIRDDDDPIKTELIVFHPAEQTITRKRVKLEAACS